jgi:transcriptional regulator with XRE-family HTH domain
MGTRKDRQELRNQSAEVIKRARNKTNVSQTRLAQLLGVSQPLVSSWECGKVTAGLDDICAIEKVLGVVKGELVFAIIHDKKETEHIPQ